MVCSICFGLYHNKRTCLQKYNDKNKKINEENKKLIKENKEINLNISIEKLIQDAISDYYCIDENINNLLTVSTNKLQNNYFEIDIIIYSRRHCGYCSDNDGSYNSDNSNEILYIQMPEILLSKYDCEKLDISCIYLNNKSNCYCGQSYEKYIIENFSFNK